MGVIIFAEILHMAFLYQIEIITIWIANDKFTFEFPYFLGGSVNIWWARDVWYGVDYISRMLVYIGLYKLMTTILLYRYGIRLNLIYILKNIVNGKYVKKDRHK